MTTTSHFSIGPNFPKVIGDIAQEHLLYQYDIEKAIYTLTGGFGMDENLAKQVLFGKDLVIRMDSPDSIIVTEREESDIYPQINPKEYILYLLNEINKEVESLASIIHDIKDDNTCQLIRKFCQLDDILKNSKNSEIVDFANQLMQMHKNLYYNELDEEDQQYSYVKSMQYIASWKNITYKRFKVIQFMFDNNWITFDDLTHDIEQEFTNIDFYENFTTVCKGYQTIMQPDEITCNSISELLTLFNNITSNSRITPTDINDKKNAYWLSPNGELYGLNGDYNALLHLQIAEMLAKHNIIQVPENDKTMPEIVLEREGWVKIHNNYIEMDPFVYNGDHTIVNHITEAQVKVIAEYIKLYYNGYGKMGMQQKNVSFVTFKAMDDIARTKLFSY